MSMNDNYLIIDHVDNKSSSQSIIQWLASKLLSNELKLIRQVIYVFYWRHNSNNTFIAKYIHFRINKLEFECYVIMYYTWGVDTAPHKHDTFTNV